MSPLSGSVYKSQKLDFRLRPRCVYPQTTSLTPVISTLLALSSDYPHPVFIFIYSLYESEEKGTGVKNKVVVFFCVSTVLIAPQYSFKKPCIVLFAV